MKNIDPNNWNVKEWRIFKSKYLPYFYLYDLEEKRNKNKIYEFGVHLPYMSMDAQIYYVYAKDDKSAIEKVEKVLKNVSKEYLLSLGYQVNQIQPEESYYENETLS